jgi:2,4-dienoyl-CoA reductase-like NADH-dependent reductase (Old Yellow Enzyme family)
MLHQEVPDMPGLFDPGTINGMTAANRLVRSATWEGLGDDTGRFDPRLLELYETLARGGVGLIISSYLYVRRDGRQSQTQLGAHEDAMIPGLTRLAEVVHGAGGKLIAQIVHCGGQARRDAIDGLQPVAPSAVESPGYPEVPRALTGPEIEQLVADFAAAAGRIQEAGFDGVQLHGAHGYLLSEFLSPSRNQREDQWGGSAQGRSRFCLEVYRAVRARVGPGFPVMIKLNAHDFLEGSTTEADSSVLAASLAAEGLDAVEVSGGTPGSGSLGATRPGIDGPGAEAYFREQARAIRRAAPDLPLILVGGIRSLEMIESLLSAGDADWIALCRPLIREPDLPQRWQAGALRRADCISCLGCFKPARTGEGVRCTVLNPVG